MPYTKVHEDWEDLPSTNTPINAAALEQMEQGIADAQDDADSANSSVGNHIAKSSAAHAASAISFSPVGSIGATNAQSAIAEVASDAAADLNSHVTDTTAAHAATAVSFSPTGSLISTTVQAAIVEVQNNITEGGTGTVESVTGGTGIDVDATDPANPEVSVDASELAADSAFTGAFAPVGAVAGAGGSGGAATHLWIGTETEYGAIGSPSATTVYVVVEDP